MGRMIHRQPNAASEREREGGGGGRDREKEQTETDSGGTKKRNLHARSPQLMAAFRLAWPGRRSAPNRKPRQPPP